MLAKEKARRQHELTENIYHLSKALLETDEEKEEVASKLRLLYQGGFRHNYSDFFPIILEIAGRTMITALTTCLRIWNPCAYSLKMITSVTTSAIPAFIQSLKNYVITSISRSAGGAIILRMSIGSRIFLPKRIP